MSRTTAAWCLASSLVCAAAVPGAEVYSDVTLQGGQTLRGWYDAETGTLRMESGSIRVPVARVRAAAPVDPPVSASTPAPAPAPAAPAAPLPAPVDYRTPALTAMLEERQRQEKAVADEAVRRQRLDAVYRETWGVPFGVAPAATTPSLRIPATLRGTYLALMWTPGEAKKVEFAPNQAPDYELGELFVTRSQRTQVLDHADLDEHGRLYLVQGDQHLVIGETNTANVVAVWCWPADPGGRPAVEPGPRLYRVVR